MNYKNLCRTKAQKGNLEAVSSILNILREYSEANPDKTFMDILFNFGVHECCMNQTSQETFKGIMEDKC
jgi:hypothetical protein